MSNITVTSQTVISKTAGSLQQGFSYSQYVGVIIASSALFVSISVLLFLIIYHKYRSRKNKLNNPGLTSNNLRYVGGLNGQYEINFGHSHINHSVSTDFYGIDDPDSLDNDNFLNSLENAIFEGYLNYSGSRISIDDNFSQSIVHNKISVYPSDVLIATLSKERSPRPTMNESVKPKGVKSKNSNHKIASIHDSIKNRLKTDTMSESIGSTSQLITSASVAHGDSSDSVCNSSKGSNQLRDISMEHRVLENKSITRYPGDLVDKMAVNGKLPNIIHSSLPRAVKPLRRTTSAYTNQIFDNNHKNRLPMTGQILDPLRAGQDINNVVGSSSNTVKQGRHLSHGRMVTNSNKIVSSRRA